MTEQTPLDVVIAYTEAWNSNAPEQLSSIWHDPVLRHDPPHATRPSSLAENQERMRKAHRDMASVRLVNCLLIAEGERVCARFEFEAGTQDRDGPQRVISGMEIFRVVRGKIVEVWNSPYVDGRWPR